MAETVLDKKPKAEGIDVDWIRQSQPMTNGNSTVQVGSFFSLAGVAGVVQRMTVLPNGVVRVAVKDEAEGGNSGVILLWPTGMEGRVVK